MPITVFSSQTLVTRIEELAEQPSLTFFRDRFFGGPPIYSSDGVIMFDVVDRARRIAPYVSPVVQGKLMEHRGFNTRSFTPAYIKPKSVVDPAQHVGTRLAGQPFGETSDLQTQHDMLVDEALEDHDQAIAIREEVQAVEALRLGQVTIAGEGYPTQVLSFGRNAALTITLSGAARWNQSGTDVLGDLEEWAGLVGTYGGGRVKDWFMGTDAWTSFLARLTDAQKNVLFDMARSSMSRAELGPRAWDYVTFRGDWGDFRLWTVNQTYQDEEGDTQALVPATAVFGAAEAALEGRMAYGAILDPRAGYAPVRAFPKNWIEEDPPRELVMTQSAPLAVPLRPNASIGITVQ